MLMSFDYLFNDEDLQKCGALRDLVPFVQFKKRENAHGGVLKKIYNPMLISFCAITLLLKFI